MDNLTKCQKKNNFLKKLAIPRIYLTPSPRTPNPFHPTLSQTKSVCSHVLFEKKSISAECIFKSISFFWAVHVVST